MSHASVEALHDPFPRQSLTISYSEPDRLTEVYGFVGRSGRVFLEGQLLRGDAPSKTLLLFMHPSSSLSLLPLPRALAAAGFHVLCCGSRYLRNDTPLIMEKVLLDMGAYVRFARETLGYEAIVLAGWSGGGSLSVFYQAQAEHPSVTSTPAGESLDIKEACLLPADALLSVAAHLSRAETLTEWIDPSVVDELNPDRRDPDLDLYAPQGPKPPYSPEFIAAFREAQRERSRRITDWCDGQLDRLRESEDGEHERGFVVHRTMADPRWLDPAVEPNGRRAEWCYQGDPRAVNVGPTGLARFTMLRSWLSQWSDDRSNAKTSDNAPSIGIPALVIENGADDATPAAHPRQIFEQLGSRDKTFRCIEGATHYYQEQPEKQVEALSLCHDWLAERGFVDFECKLSTR